jgi:hypothetical protein
LPPETLRSKARQGLQINRILHTKNTSCMPS